MFTPIQWIDLTWLSIIDPEGLLTSKDGIWNQKQRASDENSSPMFIRLVRKEMASCYKLKVFAQKKVCRADRRMQSWDWSCETWYSSHYLCLAYSEYVRLSSYIVDWVSPQVTSSSKTCCKVFPSLSWVRG